MVTYDLKSVSAPRVKRFDRNPSQELEKFGDDGVDRSMVFVRYMVVMGVLITPILMAISTVKLKKARLSLKGSNVGMKLKLHCFAIAMAVL